ncbi:LuxR C-terminal-related transcriptional regulator [Streptomyces sp. NPDC051662]|uniref:LuxR C-terminal-related transcriptional regulator n=1 Tax=Streptomyces sp. NPDC051662 TaxID=3154750 RepID=UPI003449CA11
MTTASVARVVLAPRERQVLEGLADGSTIAVVALDLKIRESTARGYLKLAKTKLHGVSDTTAALTIGYATKALTHPLLLDPDTLCLPREKRDLVALTARGMTPAQMATKLDRPVTDVRADGRELLTLLGARNRTHLVTRAWQFQILSTDLVATWLR